jgi:DNA-directed RNA polymerase specialized sigma24 family protein
VANSDFNSSSQQGPEEKAHSEEFPSTVWIRIEQAKDPAQPRSHEALTELCEAYWHPVYAFIRRKGNDPDRAADLTQGFFTLVLETRALATVSPEKGRFRSFLMAACSHYLSNQRAYNRALKRGGGRSLLSIDHLKAEDRLSREPFHEMTPERIFLRQWAWTLLDRTTARLHSEADAKGKAQLFNKIRPILLGREKGPTYAEISSALGLSEAVIKVTVHRYRNRYRELLRDEISRTVDDPAEIDQEISTLFEALLP